MLLTSNRQSVDEDSYWNKNIADKIPHVFESAIRSFNHSEGSNLEGLAKLWPLYLNGGASGLSTYWHQISSSINRHLSGAPVIKDRAGSFREPKNLMFLDRAHDRNGKPIFGELRDYVSSTYPDSVPDVLLSLGVKSPSWKWACEKIHGLYTSNFLRVKMQNKDWCSDLAKVLLKLQEPGGDGRYTISLGKIPLIPLADGTWRCSPSEKDPIYFPVTSGETIPPGLTFSLVHEDAYACPDRTRLFRELGVKDCDIPDIVRQILDYHTKGPRDHTASPGPKKSSAKCYHQDWWSKVEGRTECPQCGTWRYHFLKCPECKTKACAKCKDGIRASGHGVAKIQSAYPPYLVSQVRYLYKVRERLGHLRFGEMKNIYLECPKSKYLLMGASVYADITVDGKLQQLFSSYSEANFLCDSYFQGLDLVGKSEFAEWLRKQARVALVPRLIDDSQEVSPGLHRDFIWLLDHKIDQVLTILYENWGVYGAKMTNTAREEIAGRTFLCNSGARAALNTTYIPLPTLVEKAEAFGNTNCDFLTLPNGDPMEWKFLSSLGVGTDDGLDFHLWILKQRGFRMHNDIDHFKKLFRAIQTRTFTPNEVAKVR